MKIIECNQKCYTYLSVRQSVVDEDSPWYAISLFPSIPPSFCILFLTVYISLFIRYLLSSPVYFNPRLPALLHHSIFKYLLRSKGSERAENAINLNEMLTIKHYNLQRWPSETWILLFWILTFPSCL